VPARYHHTSSIPSGSSSAPCCPKERSTIRSEPTSWKTLVRNGLLAAVAVFVVWWGSDGAGPSAVGWLAELSAAQGAVLIGGLAVSGGPPSGGYSCTCCAGMGSS